MQVLSEHSDAYFNFINSIDSNRTRQSYEFCIQEFLIHYKTNLESLLKLPPNDISNLLIRYLVEKKISKSYKNQIFSALKHACEMNDVILNWKKLKKFIKSEKTNNETNGKDRGYTDVSYLFIDEADHFEPSVINELLHAVTRYEEESLYYNYG